MVLEYLRKGSEIWLCKVNVSDLVLVLSMYSIQVFYSNKWYVNQIVFSPLTTWLSYTYPKAEVSRERRVHDSDAEFYRQGDFPIAQINFSAFMILIIHLI